MFTDEDTETQWSYRTWLKILKISRLRSYDSQPVLLLCSPLPSCTFCMIYPIVSQGGLCSLLLMSCSLAIWGSTVSGGLLEDMPTPQSAPTLPFHLSSWCNSFSGWSLPKPGKGLCHVSHSQNLPINGFCKMPDPFCTQHRTVFQRNSHWEFYWGKKVFFGNCKDILRLASKTDGIIYSN